jgi:hypothetical protein
MLLSLSAETAPLDSKHFHAELSHWVNRIPVRTDR